MAQETKNSPSSMALRESKTNASDISKRILLGLTAGTMAGIAQKNIDTYI